MWEHGLATGGSVNHCEKERDPAGDRPRPVYSEAGQMGAESLFQSHATGVPLSLGHSLRVDRFGGSIQGSQACCLHLGQEEGASRLGEARGRGGPWALVGSPHVQGRQETHPAKNWADPPAPTKSTSAPGPQCVDQPGEVRLPGLGARRAARTPATATASGCSVPDM